MVRLEEITIINAPVERCFDLARSVEVHLAGNVHSGEMAVAVAGVNSSVTTGLIGMGQRVTWRARHFGVRWNLTSEITAMKRPGYFQDTMMRGPFGFMQHDHYFRAVGEGVTQMKDVFTIAAPFSMLGRFVEWAILHRYMRGLLRERNTVLKRIAESGEWGKYVCFRE